MAYNLASFLGKTDMSVNALTDTLESLCGFPSEDVRLISEVAADNRRKIIGLGLDPDDTTSEELYHALLIKYDEASDVFNRLINQKSNASVDKKLQKASEIIAGLDSPANVWALKRPAAKNILRTHSPKKLIKHLGYRTLESMLKRENIAELFAALPYLESSRWCKSLNQHLVALDASDYELRKAEIVIMTSKRWNEAANKVALATRVSQIGAVAIWPGVAANNTSVLGICAVTLQAIQNLAEATLPAKLHQFQPGFSKRFAALSLQPPKLKLAGHNIDWRSVSMHYSKQSVSAYPQVFDPHIEAEDLCRGEPACLLASLNPLMLWWANNSYLLYRDKKGQLVSLSLVDSVINRSANLTFKNRSISVARQALWDELISLYLAHKAVENKMTSAIEGRDVQPSKNISDFRRGRQKVRLA